MKILHIATQHNETSFSLLNLSTRKPVRFTPMKPLLRIKSMLVFYIWESQAEICRSYYMVCILPIKVKSGFKGSCKNVSIFFIYVLSIFPFFQRGEEAFNFGIFFIEWVYKTVSQFFWTNLCYDIASLDWACSRAIENDMHELAPSGEMT